MFDAPQIKQASHTQNNIAGGFCGAGSTEIIAAGLETAPQEVLRKPHTWICDSGASCHSTNNLQGTSNVRRGGVSTVGHAGAAVNATHTVDIKGQFVSRDGSVTMSATLTDVGYNPNMNYNLFSLSRMLVNGWSITDGSAKGISIGDSEGNVIHFDIVVKTPRGAIFATRFDRESEVNAASTEKGTRMNITKAHALLGHGDEESTRATAKHLGWTITRGKLKPCVQCAKSKAKQKRTVKASNSENKATKPGGRVFLDLSVVTVPKSDGSEFVLNQKQWRTLVDQATGKKWGAFFPSKSAMVEPTCQWLHQMKAHGIPVKVIRMDPAGENVKLKKRCETADWQAVQPLDFELTSRDTPQHNNIAELSFPYIAGRARAMMGGAWIPEGVRGKVCVEALKCAIQLDGLVQVECDGVLKSRDEHVFGTLPNWSTHLRTWGEAGVVTEGKNKKTGDRGIVMMFVGYSDRESDSYRFWNPDTNRVVVTRDVIFLKRMFFVQPDAKAFQVVETIDTPAELTPGKVEGQVDGESLGDEADDAAEDEEATDSDDSGDDDHDNSGSVTWADQVEAQDDPVESEAGGNATTVAPVTTRSGRIVKPVQRLIELADAMVDNMQGTASELRFLSLLAECDPDEQIQLRDVAAEFSMGCIDLPDVPELAPVDINSCFLSEEMSVQTNTVSTMTEMSLVGAGVGGGFGHTDELKVMNYREAMKSSDREAWIDEIKKEHERFEKYKVFKVVPRSQITGTQRHQNIVYNLGYEEEVQWQATREAQCARIRAIGGSTLHGGEYFIPCDESSYNTYCLDSFVRQSRLDS